MTSRGNQSVSPPAQIPQPRHVNAVSSSTPPPQQYFQGPSPALQQSAYEFLPQSHQTYLPYQTVQAYGSPINDIRGPPGNNGRAGPIQQGLPQSFYQTHGPSMRPQQVQQGPAANQACFISQQGHGTYGPPRPANQPSSQPPLMCYNFSPGNNVYTMPMYGNPAPVPVYQQNYMPAYPPAGIVCYQNGTQWRGQGMAPSGFPPYGRPLPRESKALDIIDPQTGSNIMVEIVNKKSHSADAEGVYEHPQVNINDKEICQTFARQVAESLKTPDEPSSLGVSLDSQGAIGGIPAGPSNSSQQYQQPPPQQQQPPPQQHQPLQQHPQHQPPHHQQQHQQPQHQQPSHHQHSQTPQQLQHQQFPPQQVQQQQSSSKGPGPMMRGPINGPPPTMAHQALLPRSGMNQQSPASVTPPHDIQPHQLIGVNLTVPPPQLHMRQPTQSNYSPGPQHVAHHVPHHPQTPPQQQPIRPQMPPTPHHQVLVQSQSPHQTQTNTAPGYNQIPLSNMAVNPTSQQFQPANTTSQTFQPEAVLPEKQKPPVEVTSQSNIPTLGSSAPPPTQAAKTTSPVKDISPIPPHTEQIGDIQSAPMPSSMKTTISFGDEEQINDKTEDNGRDEASQGIGSLGGAKDVRKGKKSWKGFNRKDIAGSDMDAFIDKFDETNSESGDGYISRTNNALEISTDTTVNGASVIESLTGHASFEVELGSAAIKDPDIADIRVTQKVVPELPAGVLLDNGYAKDKDNVNPPRNQEQQKHAAAAVQMDNKGKQKKKKKKVHTSPPNQKSKQSTPPNDVSEPPADGPVGEKQNEPVEVNRKVSLTLSDTDNKDLQDISSINQDNTAADQDKSVAQDKFTPTQNKSESQDTPPSSSPATQETSKMTLKESLSSVSTSVPQQQQVDDKTDITILKEDETSIAVAAVITDIATTYNSLELSRNQNHQVEQVVSSVESNQQLPEQNKESVDSDDLRNVTPEPVQSDSTVNSSEINHQVLEDEREAEQDGGYSQNELTSEIDEEVAQRKPSVEPSGNKVIRGGKEKLQYDRAYLMELRDCPSSQAKPEGLPDLEIILELPINMSRGSIGAPLDITPSFFQPSGNLRQAPQIGKTNSRNRQRTDLQIPQRVIKSVSLQDSVKPLHQSEKPWKPSPKQQSAGELAEKRRTLESEVLFIMNRLTPTNFERLAEEMKKLQIKTYEDLQEIVKIIFDKVTIETKFVEAYAKLCKFMSVLKVTPPPDSGIKDTQATFRVVMLTKCQQEFEADKTTIFEDPEEKRKKMEAEIPDSPERGAQIENTLYQMKMRRLKFYGNIRFIGELFKLSMLTETIMHDCIYRLLKAKDDESLVSLCNLIATVGQALDTDKAKSRMDHYFSQMAKISDERKSRIKFTLKDAIDLRSNNWVPRKEQTGPKKIDEVHKDFQQEQATKQFLQLQPLPPRQETLQPNNRRKRQDDKQPADDGWNTVSSKPQRIDVSKMKLSKNVVDENSIQLGPGGGMNKLSMWSRGSFGGTQQTQDNERPAANRFSALRGEEDRRGYQRSPTRGEGASTSRGSRQGSSTGHGQGKVLTRSSQEGDRRDIPSSSRFTPEGRYHNAGRDDSGNREDSRLPAAPRGYREDENVMPRSIGSQRLSNDAVLQRSAAPHSSAAAAMAVGHDVKKLKPLSEDEMEQKAKTILEEYLSALDLDEAKLCMLELEGQVHLSVFITASINKVLERPTRERDLTGLFFHEMVKHGMLSLEVYFKGLVGVLAYAEDIVIDIPKVWTYLAQIIVPMLIGGSVSWSALSASLSHVSKRDCAKLIGEILLIAKEKTSESEVAEMWQSSHMDWAIFLDPQDRLQFLKDKKLEFTVQPVDAKAYLKVSDSSQTDLQKLMEEVEAVVRRNGSNNEIFACIDKHANIEKNDKHFTRAIVTAIVNASVSPTTKKLNEDLLKSHRDVLHRYIKSKTDELQALYAVQALMNKLEHPSGVIASIFSMLCFEDVISEDAFKQWEKSTDSQEAEGRGACSMQLIQFFTWLRENEEPETS